MKIIFKELLYTLIGRKKLYMTNIYKMKLKYMKLKF